MCPTAELLWHERRSKEMEAVLVHLSRVNELGQNVSTLVHEISQPIAVVSMLAKALKRSDSPKRRQLLLELLIETSEKSLSIIEHLKSYLKNQQPNRRIRQILPVIDAALDLVSLGDNTVSAVTIETSNEEGAAIAFFDRVQIEQVISNLVRNAMEAMANTPRRILTITTAEIDEQTIEISVGDTGSGLPAGLRSRLFDPFVTTKASGLGIGLSICRAIIEAHGGRLSAKDNPGGGTIFSFTLPRAPVDRRRTTPASGIDRALDKNSPALSDNEPLPMLYAAPATGTDAGIRRIE